MFSSGNGTEKARMGKVARKGEVVVDLYAGIGCASPSVASAARPLLGIGISSHLPFIGNRQPCPASF